jgi:fumarate reductase flavoprotein subunit
VRHAAGSSDGDEAVLRRQADDEQARIEALRGRQKGGEKLAHVRSEMAKSMERGCGVYREGGAMQQACRELAQLRGRCADIALEDRSVVFNTEVVAALELQNMLDVAEAVANSAASRNESRGAHTRRDAPRRDDVNFLHHTLVHFDPAGPRLGKKPVTLGHWQPEERKY